MTLRSSLVLLALGSFLTGSSVGATLRPAATLLYPYFEVDLEAVDGRNTLLSIANTDDSPHLVNVVLWTDWSAPTLAFDLLLGAGESRSIDLRRIIVGGLLPVSGIDPVPGPGFPGCSSPLALPTLDVERRAILAGQHTGRPHPESGLCFGSPRSEPTLAIGFVTVDVVRDCSSEVRFPHQAGYFGVGGTGRAGNDNVLWGDLFFVDPSNDAAQGIDAVTVPVAGELAGPEARTFYQRYSLTEIAVGPEDGRAPLDCRSRSRFLAGGGFDGGTDLIVWSDFSGQAVEGWDCSGLVGIGAQTEMHVSWTNEAGTPVGEASVLGLATLRRLAVGEEPWLPGSAFGAAEVTTEEEFYWWNPPTIFETPVQHYVVPVHTALGRYSVSLGSAGIQGSCGSEPRTE